MVQTIVRELEMRREYLSFQPFVDHSLPSLSQSSSPKIKTIYFGGGTPSLLSKEDFEIILKTIKQFYPLEDEIEQTIECNPEDLSEDKLDALRQMGFNRLSIGLQTFYDPILRYINRAHNAQQAIQSVKLAKTFGFENMTVDLIYALPHSSTPILQSDLAQVLELNVPHISAYCCTVEEKTVFGKWEKQKKLPKIAEDFEQEQYHVLTEFLYKNGYEQYEISNFARDHRYSKHNTAYWFGHHYLGIGPGAHSFNGVQRQWNVSNNTIYIEQIQNGVLPIEVETLTTKDKINETILIRLRTKWGLDVSKLNEHTAFDLYSEKTQELKQFFTNDWVKKEGNFLFLTEKGKLWADKITEDLMI